MGEVALGLVVADLRVLFCISLKIEFYVRSILNCILPCVILLFSAITPIEGL